MTEGAMRSKREQLDGVLIALDRHCQRATYAAVGGVVELPAQSVMQGQRKAPISSWVVSKKTHLPTGYSAAERHPKLTSNPDVIQTCDELRQWLARNA
jgi:hypothetical protein